MDWSSVRYHMQWFWRLVSLRPVDSHYLELQLLSLFLCLHKYVYAQSSLMGVQPFMFSCETRQANLYLRAFRHEVLTAHAQPFKEARDLAFCLKVPLDSLLV